MGYLNRALNNPAQEARRKNFSFLETCSRGEDVADLQRSKFHLNFYLKTVAFTSLAKQEDNS